MRALVFLGDSLTAGYGVPLAASYPSIFAEEARRAGLRLRVLNAGRSGDACADGARRLARLLAEKPAYLVLALGANDMLRGVPVEQVRRELTDMILRSKSGGARVILFGMESVPFHGSHYMTEFNRLYPALAREHGLAYLPFFIRDVVLRPELNQPDQLHPNAAGQRVIAATVTRFLLPLLLEAEKEASAGTAAPGLAV